MKTEINKLRAKMLQLELCCYLLGIWVFYLLETLVLEPDEQWKWDWVVSVGLSIFIIIRMQKKGKKLKEEIIATDPNFPEEELDDLF